jgi:type I restriction enzyme S subunit
MKSYDKISASELLKSLLAERKTLVNEKKILAKNDNHIYPILDEPFNIPDNWMWCYLSEISIIQEGPGIRKHQYAEDGIQFLTVTNILEGDVDLHKSQKYISLEQYENYSHFTVNKGDIVTACSGGSWGKSAIYKLENKIILNTSTLRLRFFKDLGDNKFLYYFTKTSHFKDSLSKHITGQQANYGYSHYSKILIPLPSLTEQKKIVATLDKAFIAIDKAKANANQNLQNAKALFESYMHGVFKDKGDDWEEKTIDEVCSDIFAGGDAPKDNYSKTKTEKYTIPIFANAVKDKGLYGYTNTARVTTFSITIAARGSGTGYTELRSEAYLPIVRLIVLIPDINIVSLEFLKYKINTIDILRSGSAIPQLTVPMIKKYKIPILTIKEQQLIVQKLDALSIETKKLENHYQQKINDLEELKKSVLQKAFAGELSTGVMAG